jgi:outer membrane protein
MRSGDERPLNVRRRLSGGFLIGVKNGRAAIIGSLILGAVLPARSSAQTMPAALASAYWTNQELQAARAALRANDETVPQALAGWRPTVRLTGSIGRESLAAIDARDRRSQQYSDPMIAELTVTQPLFTSGAVDAAVAGAENRVSAGRAGLAATENQVLNQAATAYLNLLLETRLIQENRQNVERLSKQLEAARRRRALDQGTETDVAQAESRQASGEAQLAQAEATLEAQRATFRRVIGLEPVQVTFPSAIPIPATLDDARRLALDAPAVQQAQALLSAGEQDVTAAVSALLPRVDLVALEHRSDSETTRNVALHEGELLLQATVPLVDPGVTYSAVRQRKELVGQLRRQLDLARQQAVEAAVQAWQALIGARARRKSYTVAVAGATLGLTGTERGYEAGLNSFLDILNSEQDLFTARVSLDQAESDEIGASFAIATAIGALQAERLGLPVDAYYDPMRHYDGVRDRWFGLAATPDPHPAACSTAPPCPPMAAPETPARPDRAR